ncbi:2-dehydropantoate 2-reductase [Acrocarpospora pleiomorpha]|uniref:2-dehydropantoate 2-reductase n=1 Tax=Acrocarpospora pleiomorpha TaxID=90975 RepID=A0A5M3XIC3_9ACTN|nr:2-dehydropantoate 2-reductase N-terminal domain-containing protein [Acrocarpospora pleiomorpha]GES21247.1 2-dehydropantoate 2-reductase [Acrocarpospora pleiomorpha]
MRFIIIGAGAIGGTIGGRLFESGHDVVLVARGAHYAALRDGGLRFVTPGRSVTLPIPAAQGPQDVELTPSDVLLLAVKTQDTAAALDVWSGAPVRGGGTAAERLPIICAQNAVENERAALRHFARVYGMLVWLPALHLEPGTVAAYAAPLSGMLPLGRYPQSVDEFSEQVAEALSKSVFSSWPDPDVMRWKYAKLLGNLGNAIEALCGPVPGLETVMTQAVVEGRAALDAAGISYATSQEEEDKRGNRVDLVAIDGVPRPGGSSWQSLAKGSGTIEADFINGEIALLGRLHGIPTPANVVLQREANRFARERREPGSMSIETLRDLIEAAGAGATSEQQA